MQRKTFDFISDLISFNNQSIILLYLCLTCITLDRLILATTFLAKIYHAVCYTLTINGITVHIYNLSNKRATKM